ncbi:MAG: glycoside hydrolase family 28 protein [Melioribacteraceae bacterium]
MKIALIKNSFTLLFFLFISVQTFSQTNSFEITKFGAKADGVTNNSKFIQSAIDAAASSGGGKVIIPAGNFASGTIVLKSNVELHLELGARLLGSVNRQDYSDSIALALIVAKDQKNISITGKGVIDGQAPELIKNIFVMLEDGTLTDATWKFKRPAESVRPMLIHLISCQKVYLNEITVKNSASWVQNFSKCRDVVIDNIKVESTAYWNNDGIDISDCKNVKITNCFVNSADDGICLKSEDPKDFCDSITVTDCTIRSSASAFKLGTSSHGGFKNVVVRNLTIYDTYRSAIAIESVDGGVLENIDIQNITAKNTGNAIFIRLGKRNKDERISIVKGIRIADLKAEIPLRKPDLGYPFEGPPDYLRYRYNTSSKNRPDLGYPFIGQPTYPYNLIPSSIVGIPGSYIKDITLENIELNYYGAGDKKIAQIELDSLQRVPEKNSDYPEFSMFGELPSWAFFIRHADGIKMKNVKLSYKEFDFRPALVFDDVKSVELEKVEILSGTEVPIIYLNNIGKKKFTNLKLPVENESAIKEKK